MNRSTNSRESLTGRRNIAGGQPHQRRGRSLTRAPKDTDSNSNILSRNCRTSSNESQVPPPKIGVGSVESLSKVTDSGADDDLLMSGGGGKNDYDWLLSPPGTPSICSPHGSNSHSFASRGSNSRFISASTAKSSRLSVSHTEIDHSSRLTSRSSSLSRPSTSSRHYNSNSSSRASSIVNTSSSSISSYTRPSSPTISRHSTPPPRPATSKPSIQPLTTASNPKQRPFTPTSRSNNNPPSTRQATPTRRNSPTSIPTIPANGRSPTPTSRLNSPGPRARPSKPLVLPDFPQDTPPNLRTALPERPLSVGRSRPGVAVTVKGRDIQSTTTTTTCGPSNFSRRHSSPVVSNGRTVEPIINRGCVHSNNGNENLSGLTRKKPIKASATTKDESRGFGRTISKKSLDVAIRHMDIRKSNGRIQPVPGKTLSPQSHPSIIPKIHGQASVEINVIQDCNRKDNGNGSEDGMRCAKLSESEDVFESSRYDTILLKEDLINTNWLKCVDDRCDEEPVFDYGLEPSHLLESFSPFH